MKKLLPLVFALLLAGCHDKNSGVLLRLKYPSMDVTDVKFRFYTTNNGDDDNTVDNDYVRFGITLDSTIHDSIYVLKAKVDYIRMENGMGEYASDQDNSAMNRGQKMVDMSIRPVIDKTYKITINNRGELIKPYLSFDGSIVPPESMPFDFDLLQITFPKDKVDIGDDWSVTRDSPGSGLKRYFTYHIESIYNSIIQVYVSGTVVSRSAGKSEFTGRYELDEKTKKLISAKLEAPGEKLKTTVLIACK